MILLIGAALVIAVICVIMVSVFFLPMQGCIFCWKVVTEGHHLKFLCGRYKEGMVEGISWPSFLFPPTFQPFNPLTFHHFHPLTFEPFHPLTFQPFHLLNFQPFYPLIFLPFYPPTSELSALQPFHPLTFIPFYPLTFLQFRPLPEGQKLFFKVEGLRKKLWKV